MIIVILYFLIVPYLFPFRSRDEEGGWRLVTSYQLHSYLWLFQEQLEPRNYEGINNMFANEITFKYSV